MNETPATDRPRHDSRPTVPAPPMPQASAEKRFANILRRLAADLEAGRLDATVAAVSLRIATDAVERGLQ